MSAEPFVPPFHPLTMTPDAWAYSSKLELRTEVLAQAARADQAEQEVARLVVMLNAAMCPVCDQTITRGHAPDCPHLSDVEQENARLTAIIEGLTALRPEIASLLAQWVQEMDILWSQCVIEHIHIKVGPVLEALPDLLRRVLAALPAKETP